MKQESQSISIFKEYSVSTGQVLYFFGARHTNNPEDEQFDRLEKDWKEFFTNSKTERILFTEGAIRNILADYEDSVRRDESSAAQWLANRDKVYCVCPEPSSEEQRKELCALFDSKLVAYTLIVQNLSAWYRYSKQSSFEESLIRTINREAVFSDIYGFIPTKEWLYDQHKKLFDNQNLDDKDFLNLISDPRKSDTLVNGIVSARTKIPRITKCLFLNNLIT